MSGVKRPPSVTISRSEHDRLRREATNARNAEQALRAMSALNADLERSLRGAQDRINAISERAASAERKAAEAAKKNQALAGELSDTIKATNKALKAQEQAHIKGMNDLRSSVAKAMQDNNLEIEKAINESARAQRRHTDAAVAEVRKETDEKISEINKKIETMRNKLGKTEDDLAKILEMAEVHCDCAEALIDVINEVGEAHREALLPGEWREVQKAAEQAKSDIAESKDKPSFAPQAFGSARAMFNKAHDFYDRLMRAEIEWETARNEAESSVATAKATAEANSDTTMKTRNGEDVHFDVDHWSGGNISEINGQLAGLDKKLAEDTDKTLKLSDLKGISETANKLTEEAEEVAVWARLNIGVADRRAAVSARVAKALAEKAMMRVQEHGFQENDPSAAHSIIASSPTGEVEVAVTVYPASDDNGNPSFRVETDISTEGVKNREQAEEIQGKIQAVVDGVLLGEGFTTVAGHERIENSPEKVKAKKNWKTQKAKTQAQRTMKTTVN